MGSDSLSPPPPPSTHKMSDTVPTVKSFKTYIMHYNKMISRVKTIEADFQKLEEEKTQDKTVVDKKDLAHLTTATQTSQRQMGEAITTLSERIAVLLSYTAEHSSFLGNIFSFPV